MSMAQRLANGFNVKKCKVLLVGHNNANCDFDIIVKVYNMYLIIIVSNVLTPSKHFVSAVKSM